MILPENYKERVDVERLEDALHTADFLANNFIETGRYNVEESWGPEGMFYLAESSWALMDIYGLSKKPLYLNAVVSVLKALRQLQKPSGGWALHIGKDGIGFKVTDEERMETAQKEDLPPTAAMLRIISEYESITGDLSYHDLGDRAFSFLMQHWDDDQGTFVENKDDKVMALRSNPRSYSIFFFWGLKAWASNSVLIQEKQIVEKLLATIRGTFESYDNKTMPLVYGLHAATLLDYSTPEYISSTIREKIDKDLVNNKTFMSDNYPGGYGHHDGLRGIVTSEAHMRSVAGIAIAMKKYDLVTKTDTFRKTKEYSDITNWIQHMKGDGFYYEFEYLSDKKPRGWGSPGQYLPIWWILGKV